MALMADEGNSFWVGSVGIAIARRDMVKSVFLCLSQADLEPLHSLARKRILYV
jgi:hypothetical protein